MEKKSLLIILLLILLPQYAFCDLQSITKASIEGFIFPESLKVIEDSAFEGTSTDIVILSGNVESIGDRTFFGIYSLKAVYIPISVELIGDNSFDSNAFIIGEKYSFAYKWSKANSRHFTVYPTISVDDRNNLIIYNSFTRTRKIELNKLSFYQIDNYKRSSGLTIGELKLIRTTCNTDFRIEGRAPPIIIYL